MEEFQLYCTSTAKSRKITVVGELLQSCSSFLKRKGERILYLRLFALTLATAI